MGCCYGCGLQYGGEFWIEAIIPDRAWNEISPTGNQGGLLCITCISKRLQEHGFFDVPVWLCGTEPLKAMPGDPGDMNSLILRSWFQEKSLRGYLEKAESKE